MVRVLARSYRAQHPEQPFFALIVARGLERRLFADEPYTAVFLDEIGLSDLAGLGMKYNILELNTNVKPQFMLRLLEHHGFERLIYLDPDIFVYRPLTPAFELLGGKSAILTPHITSPADAAVEQELLYNGTFNLGFLGVTNGDEAFKMLRWWNVRCVEDGFSEGRSGLFVDQKWMNLAPALFEGVVQCKEPGFNVGFWNFHERAVTQSGSEYRVNGGPLYFFHFSGVVLDDAEVLSRNTTRYSFDNRPGLRKLYDEYKEQVREASRPSLDRLEYGFEAFADGTAITPLARRIYAAHQKLFLGEDPFSVSSRFNRFAVRSGLTAGRVKPSKVGWKDMKENDRRVAVVHCLLRFALRILGPNRYELLMRYLGSITILRNQGAFLRPREDCLHPDR